MLLSYRPSPLYRLTSLYQQIPDVPFFGQLRAQYLQLGERLGMPLLCRQSMACMLPLARTVVRSSESA